MAKLILFGLLDLLIWVQVAVAAPLVVTVQVVPRRGQLPSIGILALSEGSAAGRAVDLEGSAERLDAVSETGQSRPLAGIGASHTIVGDLDLQGAVLGHAPPPRRPGHARA